MEGRVKFLNFEIGFAFSLLFLFFSWLSFLWSWFSKFSSELSLCCMLRLALLFLLFQLLPNLPEAYRSICLEFLIMFLQTPVPTVLMCGFEKHGPAAFVVPSGCLVARAFLFARPIATAFFSVFSHPGRVFVGWVGVRWDVDVQLHLRHEVHATSRMGWGGIGMLTSSCTCVMTLMLRHGWGGMLTSSCTWLVSCGLWSFERRQQLAERVKKKCCRNQTQQ